jgi:hypothetical protein
VKKYSFYTTILLVTVIVSGIGFKQDSSTFFKSKAGKFSIIFPGQPVESSSKVETEVGTVKLHMFMHEASDTKAFMVAYCDYAKKHIAGTEPFTLLDGAKDGVVGQFKATITSENKSNFQGFPSIDFVAEGDEYNTSYKLLLVNNRLYQVGILVSGKQVTELETKSFIGSFMIH